MLQRYAPLPAKRVGNGSCVGDWVSIGRRLHRNSPVTGQPVRPVFKRRRQSLVDQKRGKTAAVDKEIRLYFLPRFQHHVADIAGCVLVHRHDPAFNPFHASLFGPATQVLGIAGRIQMVGIVERVLLQKPKSTSSCSHQVRRVNTVVITDAQFFAL